MRDSLKDSGQPEHQNSSLVVGWSGDAGKLGETVTDYLIRKLNGHSFCEIEPAEYFPLGGVTVEDDVVQFPESKFYICPEHNLVILKSTHPSFEIYRFFNQVLEIAEYNLKVKEIYVIGGMVSINAHTSPRQLLGTFSSIEVKQDFSSYDINSASSYETASGQKPTLNSFLLWVTKKRNLAGIDLWVAIPFYLMSLPDPKSHKKILEFFNQRFKLGIELSEFDEAIKKQNRKINEARSIYPEIDDYLVRLESNLTLSEDENLKLVKQIEEYLKQ